MPDISSTLAQARNAIDEMIVAAEGAESRWTTPRATGKWSPAQVTEHVARSFEEAANVVAGAPSKFPRFPALLRMVARGLGFNRVVRKNAWVLPRAKTFPAFDPEAGPATPAEARTRLHGALQKLEEASRACAARDGMVETTTFGRVPLESYLVFNTQHARHHTKHIAQA